MKLPFKNNLFYNLKSNFDHEGRPEEALDEFEHEKEIPLPPVPSKNVIQEPTATYGKQEIDHQNQTDNVQVIIQKIEINQANEISEEAPKRPKVVWGNAQQPAKIKLKFTTTPAPQYLRELAFFRIDLMRSLSDNDFTFISTLAKFKDSGSSRNYRNKTITIPSGIEDGNYFLRIIALDEEEYPLNVEEEALQEDLIHTQKISSDTSIFFFTDSEENISSVENLMFEVNEEELPPVSEVSSTIDHWLYTFVNLRLQNITDAQPITGTTGFRLQTSRGTHLESVYETILKPVNKSLKVCLPEKLAIIEQCILANPTHVDPLLVDIKNYGPLREGAITLTEVAEGENDWIPASFRVKRAEVFAAIRASAANGKGVWETFDIYNHIELIRDYVEEYQHWLSKISRKLKKIDDLAPEEQEDLYEMLQVVQNLDLVHAKTLLPQQKIGTVFLQTPLHPMRMIWSLNFWHWYQNWESQLLEEEENHQEWIEALQEYLQTTMMPQNNPLLLNIEDKVYQYSGELANGWGVYLITVQEKKAATTLNQQAHMLKYWQEVFNLLPVNQQLALSAEEIIGQIQSYLVRYPEKKELHINVLNADEGQTLIEALYWLTTQPETQDLHYTLWLFTSSQSFVQTGSAFEALTEETPALFEQIKIGVVAIDDFFKTPEEFISDLTFLVQPFTAQPILLAQDTQQVPPTQLQQSLIQVPSLLTQVNGQVKISRWVGSMTHFLHEDEQEDRLHLARSFEFWQQLSVTNLAGQVTEALPATQLTLALPEKVLFDKASEASEWVIIKDQHITPEIFDFAPNKHQLPHLLALDISNGLVVTQRRDNPLQAIDYQLKDIGHNWSNSPERIQKLAEHLEVSGFPWYDFPQQALDMALTKMLLEKFDFLNDHFIIPIGKHPQWFPSEHQAHLLLVALDTEERNIWVQIISVASGDNLTIEEVASIKQQMKRDINNTYKALLPRMKPHKLLPQEATIINDLRKFLRFYIKRATRYQSLDFTVAERYQQFLNGLETGYDVVPGKLGIIYDHVGFGQIEKKQEDNGWLFFEVGSRFVQALLQNL